MDTRPNIIFYFSDQQRWDTCGCYGQALNVTPNLDALAADGVLFEQAFTCQPVCGPARACLQSGQYATANGCFTNGIAFDFKQKGLADYFNEAGYQTAYVGKWHLASDRAKKISYEEAGIPTECRAGYQTYWMASDLLESTSHGYNGFVFDSENRKVEFTGYRADCINNYAIDFLHQYDGSAPFFLFVSQLEPHHQNDHDCYEAPDGYAQKFADYTPPKDLPKGKGNWEKEYPAYLGCCHSLDENLGRLIATLKEQELYENTIIIYTADHGSHFKTRNREYKRSCHEASIHLPMIFHGPGFAGGKRISDIVSLIDMPATLLDCAGIPVPECYHGHSIKPLLCETPTDWQQEAFLQISESQVARAIRTDRYKYCVRADADAWQDAGADTYYEFEFYDLSLDPIEQDNKINDPAYAAVRANLAERLKERMVQAGETRPTILHADLQPAALKVDSYYYKPATTL
ncbi:MAG: sulfatase-like hydrolase/transferase [Faecalibacterium sp.]